MADLYASYDLLEAAEPEGTDYTRDLTLLPGQSVTDQHWNAETAQSSSFVATGCTVTESTAQKYSGARSFLMSVTGTPTNAHLRQTTSNRVVVSAGMQCLARARVYAPAGHSDTRMVIDWFTAAGAFISSTNTGAVNVPAGTWTYIEHRATAPATAARMGYGPEMFGSPATGKQLYVDNLRGAAATTSRWAAIAIHGGGIEIGTTEVAAAVGAGLMNTYVFDGRQSANNSDLHVTSTNFDEPRARVLVAGSTKTLSFHGYTGTTGLAEISIGGIDTVLRDVLRAKLTAAGFRCIIASSEIAGTDPNNICNRNASGAGVQLELSRALRQSFFPGGDWSRAARESGQRTATFYTFVTAVRSALLAWHSLSSRNVSRRAVLAGLDVADVDVYGTVAVPVLATGGTIFAGVMSRYADSSNHYIGEVQIRDDNTVEWRIRKSTTAAGLVDLASGTTVLVHTAGASYRLKLRTIGETVQLKVWPASEGEPQAWTATVDDPATTLTSGTVGCRSVLSSSNTNTLPVLVGFGDFTASTLQTDMNDVTGRVLDDPPLQIGWGRDTGRAYGAAPAGKLTFNLRNDDRVFMPNNTASPIYGNVTPGRRVRLTHDSLVLFDGTLDEFDIDRRAAAKDFQATALDGWGRPGGENLSTDLYRGIWTGDAVHVVLDAIGWTGERDIDRGVTAMQWWWAEDEDAATAIEKIVDSEGPGAAAYVEGGTFVFRSRYHRVVDDRALTPQAMWTHAIPAGSASAGELKVAPDYSYDFGTRNIYNTVRFTVDERAVQPHDKVWSTDETFYIAAGSTIALEAQASDPFINAWTPVEGIDYTLLSGSVNVRLWRDCGQATAIYVTAGATTAVVQGLALRAQPVTVTRQRKVTAVDLESRQRHSVQTWERDVPWCNQWDAEAIAKMIVAMYGQPRPLMAVTIANINGNYETEIQARRISDRVTVRLDDTGFNGDIHVERVDHEIIKLGAIHRMTVRGEPVVENPDNVFILDDPVNGVLDAGFVLAREGIPSPNLFILDDPARGVLNTNHIA